jgi:hypothetical protein
MCLLNIYQLEKDVWGQGYRVVGNTKAEELNTSWSYIDILDTVMNGSVMNTTMI